jgi:hypothetical protein
MNADKLAAYLEQIARETGALNVFVMVSTREGGLFSCLSNEPHELAKALRQVAKRIEEEELQEPRKLKFAEN